MNKKELLDFVKRDCEKNGVEVLLPNKPFVLSNDHPCNGYFTHKPTPTLAVGVGKDESLWMPTLVHEYQHMQQWKEDCKLWNNVFLNENVECNDLIDFWLSHMLELTEEQKQKYMIPVLILEKDCEKRAVKFILKNKLDSFIDVKDYIRKANAYLMFHHMVMKKRVWYKIGSEPYAIPSVFNAMPDHLNFDHTKITPNMEKVLMACVPKKKS